ncbi:hypothetical protein TNCV_781681 [Trichonephila clavipes]|nr:hypothetical protein TNCV_781681 [Trichonephila clavipes]
MSLKPFSHPKFDSNRIHFRTELLTKVCNESNIPEFARQIALETIHDVPPSALEIYTDGSSMDDGGISGSGAHTLKYLMVHLTSRDIWILTDSRASIQYDNCSSLDNC